MRRLCIVVAAVGIVAIILAGCAGAGADAGADVGAGADNPTTGTLTVTLSGAADQNGKLLAVGIWDKDDGPWANEPIEGTFGDATITAGTATVQIEPWDGMEAATQYDVFIFIFMESGGPPQPGTDLLYKGGPIAWLVDGDRTIPAEYDDFEDFEE